jgi:hypothetical protein
VTWPESVLSVTSILPGEVVYFSALSSRIHNNLRKLEKSPVVGQFEILFL